MSRRSKMEIYISILETTKYASLKLTHIMYKTNINSSILKLHLEFLVEKGYIVKVYDPKTRFVYQDNKKNFYRITEKGIELLNAYNKIKEVLQLAKY